MQESCLKLTSKSNDGSNRLAPPVIGTVSSTDDDMNGKNRHTKRFLKSVSYMADADDSGFSEICLEDDVHASLRRGHVEEITSEAVFKDVPATCYSTPSKPSSFKIPLGSLESNSQSIPSAPCKLSRALKRSVDIEFDTSVNTYHNKSKVGQSTSIRKALDIKFQETETDKAVSANITCLNQNGIVTSNLRCNNKTERKLSINITDSMGCQPKRVELDAPYNDTIKITNNGVKQLHVLPTSSPYSVATDGFPKVQNKPIVVRMTTNPNMLNLPTQNNVLNKSLLSVHCMGGGTISNNWDTNAVSVPALHILPQLSLQLGNRIGVNRNIKLTNVNDHKLRFSGIYQQIPQISNPFNARMIYSDVSDPDSPLYETQKNDNVKSGAIFKHTEATDNVTYTGFPNNVHVNTNSSMAFPIPLNLTTLSSQPNNMPTHQSSVALSSTEISRPGLTCPLPSTSAKIHTTAAVEGYFPNSHLFSNTQEKTEMKENLKTITNERFERSEVSICDVPILLPYSDISDDDDGHMFAKDINNIAIGNYSTDTGDLLSTETNSESSCDETAKAKQLKIGGLSKIKKFRRKPLTPRKSAAKLDPRFKGVTVWLQTEFKNGDSQLQISAFYSNVKLGFPKRCHGSSSPQPFGMSPIYSCSEADVHQTNHHKDTHFSTKTCASCRTRRTPLWRDAEDGTPLCNACGIRYKKYRLRCSRCWHIPKKDIKTYPNCPACGAALRFSFHRKSW